MRKPYQLLIAILLFLATPTMAQETAVTCGTSSLYGQILSSDPRKPLRAVEVLAKRASDKGILDKQESQEEWYCVKVPTPSRVFLFFQSDGYDPQRSNYIDTGIIGKRHSWPVAIIKLDPIALVQSSIQSEKSHQKRQRIRARLNKHKESIDPSGPNDLFIWNIEFYKEAYREDPDATAEINQFLAELKADPQFYFLETDEYKQKSKLFRFIIARNQSRLVESDIKPAELVALIDSSTIPSGIRENAIITLASLTTLTPTEKEQVVASFLKTLEQDRSVGIRIKAAEGLGVLGDQPEVLAALRRVAEKDESPKVQSAANVAARMVANRPTGAPMRAPGTELAMTWTTVEYPIDQEVIVKLTPTVAVANTKGKARVVRTASGTTIHLDLSGLPNDVTNLNLYAVDPMGHVTLLGIVTATKGTATFRTTTPLTSFMLVISPDPNLTTISPNTTIALRSSVPEGLAVVPLLSSGERDGAAVGEKVSATTTGGGTPAYAAPMLGIPGFRRGTDTEMNIKFSGEMTGARANVYLEPRKDGPTTIRMRFHELKEAPAGRVYVLWAVSPDNKFVKLGQIVNTGQRNEAEIRTETALRDFGLFVTLEEEHANPTGTMIGTVIK